MTPSTHRRPIIEKVPTLEESVVNELVDGVYKISLPTLKKSDLVIDGKRQCSTIQLRCNSCCVKSPDTVTKCNSIVKTIVGGGTGDQCEIVECGKCRTSYMIRTIYDKEGKLHLNVSVWNIGRNLEMFCRREHDKDLNFLLRFHTEEKNDKSS